MLSILISSISKPITQINFWLTLFVHTESDTVVVGQHVLYSVEAIFAKAAVLLSLIFSQLAPNSSDK